MNSKPEYSDPGDKQFLAAVEELAAPLNWHVRSFEREEQLVALVALDHDATFEQVLWIYDRAGGFVRCLLVARGTVPADREPAIFELCARVNDGLVFGCAEYSFDDRAVVFRDAIRLGQGALNDVLGGMTARLLELGSHYAPAVRAALAGMSPAKAIEATSDAADGAKGKASH